LIFCGLFRSWLLCSWNLLNLDWSIGLLNLRKHIRNRSWLSWSSWSFINWSSWSFMNWSSWSFINWSLLLGSSWSLLLGGSWSLSRLVITKGVLSPWIVSLVEAFVILAEALECAEATL